MAYDFSSFKTRLQEIEQWLKEEYTHIRTGQATPALLDSVRVAAYGAQTPLNQLASVMTEDARTLAVNVWDGSLLNEVEAAIRDADLGVSVVNSGDGLRVIFPELTAERREQLLKLAKTKLEDARVSVRGARDDEVKKFADLASDDERHDAKEEIQQLVDKANENLANLFDKKEDEINQ